jgi:hypothetical protein
VRVELAAEVLVEDDCAERYDLNALYALLRCFADGPHDWVADERVVAAAAAFLPRHLPQQAQTYLELARDGLVGQRGWTGTSQATEVVRVERADLDDLSADLCRPAVLVLENHESDGYFITAIAHAFGADRVRTALVREWLQIEHGGGGDLVKVAERAAGRFRRLTRVVALLDSDRLVPRQRTANDDNAERLAASRIVTHVLILREAENYAPHRVLAAIGRRREAADKLRAFKTLDRDQRGHFDMKKGFGPTNGPPKIKEEQTVLYANLGRQARFALRGGFGQDILKRMHDSRESLSAKDFAHLGETAVAELRELLAAVESRI